MNVGMLTKPGLDPFHPGSLSFRLRPFRNARAATVISLLTVLIPSSLPQGFLGRSVELCLSMGEKSRFEVDAYRPTTVDPEHDIR